MAACYKLHAAVFHALHGLEQECEVHLAQHVLLEETQQEVKRLRAELDEVQRPLDAQMARLNRRVIDLTAELDALRLKLPGAGAPLPRHKFWGAGEPDCPADLKAPNGELHTMRCKVCGAGWRKSVDVCLVAIGVQPSAEDQLKGTS